MIRKSYLITVIPFIVFAVVGFWAGRNIRQTWQSPFNHPLGAAPAHAMPSLQNGQRSLLIVGVTTMDENARLESLWLATYFPNNSPIRLMPIYPNEKGAHTGLGFQISQVFGLEFERGDINLPSQFVQLLIDHNYWWSGYILLDQYAAVQILNFLTSSETNGSEDRGQQALAGIASVTNQSRAAYFQQAALLQDTCWKLAELPSSTDWSSLDELIPDHLFTDLDPRQLIEDWQLFMSYPHTPLCEFPLFEQIQFSP